MNNQNGSGERVRSVETAFQVLETMKHNEDVGISAIADELEIAKSTVYNHLSTLEQLGYVVKSNGTYKLGLRFLDLGYHARTRYNLYEVAKPEADDLAERTGDRCQVMVREGHEGVYVYQASGEQAIGTDSHIGTRVNLHATAVGKAYLAHLPEDERDEILETNSLKALTEKTITDYDTLFEELEESRNRGYTFNDEERLLGMRAVGAPILSEDGTALGALSISGPTTRFQGERYRSELPEFVSRTARVIGIKVTYR